MLLVGDEDLDVDKDTAGSNGGVFACCAISDGLTGPRPFLDFPNRWQFRYGRTGLGEFA